MQYETVQVSELTEHEISERVAILHRLRTLLDRQRGKFRSYLQILEKQYDGIADDDTDSLIAYTEMEEHLVADIGTVQKVLRPIEDMLRTSYPNDSNELPKMKADLFDLQEKVLAQNKKNRDLLKNRMVHLRQQITLLKNPYAKRSSIYAGDSQSANIVDIHS